MRNVSSKGDLCASTFAIHRFNVICSQLNYSDFRLNYSDEYDKYMEPMGTHERTFGEKKDK